MRVQICEAALGAGPAGESAHRGGGIEFSGELEDDAALSGFGGPRPRAGRVGEVANLYGYVLDNIWTDPMPPTTCNR